MNKKNIEKAKNIKMLILDVDGVLTDGKIFYDTNGNESVAFDVHDGLGIAQAIKQGLKFAIITGRDSEAVKARIAYLNITDFYKGAINKTEPYEEIKKKYNLSDNEIAYVGDDILDIPVLQRAGFAVATKNARREAKRYADYVTESVGGNGAVREIIDFIFNSQDKKLLD